jgi:hypothetical protein
MGKILNSLFVVFMVLKCIEEKNFKTTYEVKEEQIYYYTSKTKWGYVRHLTTFNHFVL